MMQANTTNAGKVAIVIEILERSSNFTYSIRQLLIWMVRQYRNLGPLALTLRGDDDQEHLLVVLHALRRSLEKTQVSDQKQKVPLSKKLAEVAGMKFTCADVRFSQRQNRWVTDEHACTVLFSPHTAESSFLQEVRSARLLQFPGWDKCRPTHKIEQKKVCV